MKHENNGDANCNWHARYSHQRFVTGTRGLRNKQTSSDHPNYSFAEICHNTEKSPGDMKRLTVPQTPVKNSLLRWFQKTSKDNNKVPQPCQRIEKLWNKPVAIIPTVIGAFGTVTKGLLKGLEDLEVGGRVDTVQTTALLRILRRVLVTWGDLLSLKL